MQADIEIVKHQPLFTLCYGTEKGRKFMQKLVISSWIDSCIIAQVKNTKTLNIILDNAKKLNVTYEFIEVIE